MGDQRTDCAIETNGKANHVRLSKPPEAQPSDKLVVTTPIQFLSSAHRWQGLQRRIGLTGGIASGKSSVGHYLEQQGLPVLDADIYAHEALAPGSPGAEAVIQRYGPQVEASLHTSDEAAASEMHRIDRRALGQIVFNNPAERQWLEQLIHPVVRARFNQEIDREPQASAIVLMIPLLFEAGLEALCSEIWVVQCTPTQQLTRLCQRDGLDQEAALARVRAQWPMREKCQHADLVLDNSGAPERWKAQIAEQLHWSS
ncbi:MAG: dephospho-CoA kinase [Synechococcus sp. NAT40]|nr:dephospho-CoA kinase [Synechococcus sp. NAT40]